MKQYTEVAIQDLKDPMRVTPKKGQQASCEQGQDFLIELKYRQNRWEQRQYIIKKNIWQAAIDDKIVGGVFARSVGVDTPSILWCSARVSHAPSIPFSPVRPAPCRTRRVSTRFRSNSRHRGATRLCSRCASVLAAEVESGRERV